MDRGPTNEGFSQFLPIWLGIMNGQILKHDFNILISIVLDQVRSIGIIVFPSTKTPKPSGP